MAAALLRAGCTGEVRDYVRWYAGHQAPDGTVPCCVDRNGPDWLAEYDSQGELIRERSEEHTSELQSHHELVCRLLLEKKNKNTTTFATKLIKTFKKRHSATEPP